MSAACKSCGRPIQWATSEQGKAMPLDVPPERRVVITGGVARVVPTYLSHFATCPNAAQHRKPRGEQLELGGGDGK